MSCSSCGNGRSGVPSGCGNNGHCASGGCNKLNVFNYLSNMEFPADHAVSSYVEVQFKGTRKAFYKWEGDGLLSKGTPIAVESDHGFDVGTVSLSGDLVPIQMSRRKVEPASSDIKKVMRLAEEKDIENWQKQIEREQETMVKARKLAREMSLAMKISDVEYQGDGTKAIFYYTSEERVDFRELIRKLAAEFNVRVEMKQIGSRQEAGRLGGLGTCGRELCCSTWLTDFRSVTTKAARYQQLSLNPAKLAGQCGKLKCCLNYELDSYVDALKDFPSLKTKLQTAKGTAHPQKVDIFKGVMWFTYRDDPSNFIMLKVETVKEIVELNKKGEKPAALFGEQEVEVKPKHDFENVVGQDDLSRFDKPKKSKGRGGKGRNKSKGKGNAQASAKPGNKSESGNNKNRNRNRNRNRNKKKGSGQGQSNPEAKK